MPDIYIVMSDLELNEAVNYAKENGALEATIIENIQYRLLFNRVDAITYCEEGKWFPHYSHYITLKTKDDEIGILLSSTVWNDFELTKVYEILKSCGISYKLVEDKWYSHDSVSEFNEKNRLVAKKYPINSPWTARDLEVVESALENIEAINFAKIMCNANVEINIFKYLLNGTPIPTENHIVTLKYPNVLHLDTDNGEYNVFMGESINVEEVKKLLAKSNVLFNTNQYDPFTDASSILYSPRDKNIWEEGKKGKII